YEVSTKLTTPDTSIDEVDCRRVKLLPYTYTPKTPESYCYEGEYLHIVGPDADSAASDLEVAIKFAYHTPRPAVSSPLSD
ncbi:MAG: hypothetical protein ACE5FH_13220, partial [Candidatus Zixiibacteriota bacterium]